ncbi:R3H and coiled-coil domain-containing protein 1 isoform X1 [Centroberyx affinis]|uniref:R3H and coiled-coil domain-containing protein 1 isoform X1 n=1 Tax=Centroberyx affinis TaxID=166261 RepID=UPI003A5BC200
MVLDELDTYQQKRNCKSLLLFPPLPSRLRYLIHRTIEDLPELTTFSVGESWCRRVVVCYSELKGEVEEDSDLESNSSFCDESPRPRGREEMERAAKPKSSSSLRNRRPKRPDKPLYMPRAARERLSFQNSPEPPRGLELPSPGSCSCSCISTSSDSCSSSDNTENTRSSSTSNQESLPSMPHSVADSICDRGPDSSPLCPQDEEQDVVLKLHEAEPLAWDQTVSYFTAMTLEEDKEDLASMPYSPQTADMSTDIADLNEEIMAHLKEAVAVSIEHAHNDYSCYENVWMNSDDFGHVIEIYDFPAMFKTDDLLDAFTEYSDGGMRIKWVDNTHALGVFSSESAALHALSIRHPLLKARTLSEGSKKAKAKAIRSGEFIQPVKERPRTDCAVARRMVARALGLQRGRTQQY